MALLGVAALLLMAILASVVIFFLQTGWSHRRSGFSTERIREDLTDVLHKSRLSEADYELLFQQTGLAPAAVDDLLQQGEAGRETILETQEGFFTAPRARCVPLLGGRLTCQDLLQSETGEPVYGVPLAPLQEGDILLSFSTHTLGWHHGHAGLVIDPARGAVLEAVQPGINSYAARVDHWRSYANFLVLRVRDVSAELCRQVADFANRKLRDVPYSLLPGLIGPKTQPVEEGPGIHCAYLPWYAWNHAGVDLDANGGRIVTVGDLARSPELEVVQVFGMDPALLANRQSTSASF